MQKTNSEYFKDDFIGMTGWLCCITARDMVVCLNWRMIAMYLLHSKRHDSVFEQDDCIVFLHSKRHDSVFEQDDCIVWSVTARDMTVYLLQSKRHDSIFKGWLYFMICYSKRHDSVCEGWLHCVFYTARDMTVCMKDDCVVSVTAREAGSPE